MGLKRRSRLSTIVKKNENLLMEYKFYYNYICKMIKRIQIFHL